MLIKLKDVKHPPYINLGFICDLEKQDLNDRNYKIRAWAPKAAKSFKIISESFIPDGKVMRGSVEVGYFTTEKEGICFSELPKDKFGRV